MLYVLGSILFIASSILAVAVIVTQMLRYKELATIALRGLSMDGWSNKTRETKTVPAGALAQRFNLQPAQLPWKPRAAV